MAQPSVASYFSSRKRAAVDDVNTSRLKVDPSIEPPPSKLSSTSKTIKRVEIAAEIIKELSKDSSKSQQQKLVKFIKAGSLSPRKRVAPVNHDDSNIFASKESISNSERGPKTPCKAKEKPEIFDEKKLKSAVAKELKFEEVKAKVTRSAKLNELKASLGRLQELEKIRKQQAERNRKLKDGESVSKASGVTLKEFKTIELEVLSSPTKLLKTPTKTVPPPPDKNELMSPKNATPKKIFFSPSKDGSPSKLIVTPAYQRFQNLTESGRPALQLPFKYRSLIEMFKSVDSVCAMFYNRKEVITFKKLKPAVQRMLRKNFTESHLAQIKFLYPDAFIFSQMKTRNYGSMSKQDYFQLIINPNVECRKDGGLVIDDDNVLKSAESSAMNPQVIIKRYQKFTNILLDKVKEEHDKFLKSLDPPLIIPMNKVTRWHPEFELENCQEIQQAVLPQPPNIEKYSSAKDILSTARNLFNCSTPGERSMQRLQEKQNENSEEISKLLGNKDQDKTTQTLLKGVPKTLLEKIRAKQAAKALDAMTRRPSQDREAIKYSRLPELARHLRNVFITEKKSVLTLELIVKKIGNSFRTNMTPREIEDHLRLIAKECPNWIVFHEIRKTLYVKMDKVAELSKVVEQLEKSANEKTN